MFLLSFVRLFIIRISSSSSSLGTKTEYSYKRIARSVQKSYTPVKYDFLKRLVGISVAYKQFLQGKDLRSMKISTYRIVGKRAIISSKMVAKVGRIEVKME